jgi:hypothetical protein
MNSIVVFYLLDSTRRMVHNSALLSRIGTRGGALEQCRAADNWHIITLLRYMVVNAIYDKPGISLKQRYPRNEMSAQLQ